ncbi:hypothetical protein PP577_18540 [Mycobacteroides abscessus]|nr:hypothetical protein [Mycobacteroides abscessus]MDM2426870.1 hypothetical protein [Mycobacteroides abscessus]MDM2431800.1 hypothetical protein [Mycobacteroides abscessus]MDM2436588.1 hypothetical protein [Mycobacteroides abscessus]MDM2438887.1 hypothetical protein [Mycobacteroides abscessus]
MTMALAGWQHKTQTIVDRIAQVQARQLRPKPVPRTRKPQTPAIRKKKVMPTTEVTPVVWKRVPFLPKKFQVSNNGQARILPYTKEYPQADGSIKTRSFRARKLVVRKGDGHVEEARNNLYVAIYLGTSRDNARARLYRLDNLVASAFHGVPCELHNRRERQKWRIMHIDNDPMNCRADNLEWIPHFGGVTQVHYEEQFRIWRRVSRSISTDWFMERFYPEVSA